MAFWINLPESHQGPIDDAKLHNLALGDRMKRIAELMRERRRKRSSIVVENKKQEDKAKQSQTASRR